MSPRFLLYVFGFARLAHGVCVHSQRLWGHGVAIRHGNTAARSWEAHRSASQVRRRSGTRQIDYPQAVGARHCGGKRKRRCGTFCPMGKGPTLEELHPSDISGGKRRRKTWCRLVHDMRWTVGLYARSTATRVRSAGR